MEQITLRTDRLILKTLSSKDYRLVSNYYLENRAFLKPWEPLRSEGFFSEAFQEKSLELDEYAMDRGEMYRFWMFTQENELIGTVAITNIIRGVFKSAYLGYKLSEKYARKGFGLEAVKATVKFAFDVLELHRLEANIIPRNIASIHLITAAGFEFEGCSKAYLKINGRWEDHSRYALINKSYKDIE